MLTEQERAFAVQHLEKSRKVLIHAVADVTEEQARWQPSADRWSILGYVEHLAVSDDALTAMVQAILATPAVQETAEERAARREKINNTHPPRGTVKAPDALAPNGRFATLADALAAFNAARDRTIEFAKATQDDLHNHFRSHPAYGALSGFDWLVGNAKHAISHAGHIDELKEMMKGSTANA
jgi:hypothetical protein